MLYSNGADAKNEENKAVAMCSGCRPKKKDLSHVMLQTMGFLSEKMKTPSAAGIWAWKRKKISKLNGAMMFFYTPCHYKMTVAEELFFPESCSRNKKISPIRKEKKHSIRVKGFPTFLSLSRRTQLGLKKNKINALHQVVFYFSQ